MTKRYAIFSVLVHLAIFFPFVFVGFASHSKSIGNVKIAQAYLYTPAIIASDHVNKSEQHQTQIKHTIEKEPLQMHALKSIAPHKAQQASSHKQASLSHVQKQGAPQPLLILIHNLIQQQQQYPTSARMLGQQGVTVVNFKLTPSGFISKVNVAHSSGYQILDKAAIDAVSQVPQPITQAHVLHNSTMLTIDIKFS